MSLLVLGAGGLLGAEIAERSARWGVPCATRGHAECDITDASAVRRALAESGATLAVNCAAYNAVDRAESEALEAMRVNCDGAANVAREGEAVVHFSTDFVFDGRKTTPYTEADEPRPLSAYARSKASGDAAVLAANPRCFLVRVGCLYGPRGHNFGSSVLARLRAGERIRADGERRVQPTWVGAVAEQVLGLVLSSSNAGACPFGVYHSMCHGETTWADFARELSRQAGYSPALVDSVATSALASAAARPAYAVLENRALGALGLDRMPAWEAALSQYLEGALSK